MGRRFDASQGPANVAGKNEMSDPKPAPKPENLLLNIACNIVVPTLVLTKLSTADRLGPLWGLVVALAFPVGYGAYYLATRKKTNALSILGFVSVLVSGTLALAKVGGLGFAIKDAVLPTLMGFEIGRAHV